MIRRTTLLGCVLALALPIVGCDSDPDPVDGGGGTDAGGDTDAGMTTELPDPVTIQDSAMMATAADYACRGTAVAPTAGADVSFTIEARDFFESEFVVEGLTVDFFPDGVVTDGCTGTCMSTTTDASGQATVMAGEGGWFAYRISAGDGQRVGPDAPTETDAYVSAVQVNEVTPAASETSTLNAVRASTITTVGSIAGLVPQPGTAIVTGTAEDCAGNAVQNAQLRVFNAAGEIEFGSASSGPRRFYFVGSIPNSMRSASTENGLFGAGNLPADGPLRVEVWGVPAAGGELELLGCEMVEPVADGISIVTVGGVRSDGPTDCSGS
ncbi:MAG: hypothetical protein AB8I08_28770 [Sandaracinaceae bacterium]